MGETVNGVGRHMICEFWGASNLENAEHTEHALLRAVKAGKATLIKTVVHQFAPQGVSGVAVLAESHISIHTWPETGYAAIDYFTCGDHVAEAVSKLGANENASRKAAEVVLQVAEGPAREVP